MAENKKSFVLYADLLKSIEHLTNEEKGILFNHLLEYVNDKNPTLNDRLILTAWKPIELQLKRDLVKFEEVKAKRSDAGKLSAELRALKKEQQASTNSTCVKFVEQTPTNSTVNDNDNDNDNVSEIKEIKKENFLSIDEYEEFREYEFSNLEETFIDALKQNVGIDRPIVWCNRKLPCEYFDLVECLIKVKEDSEWRSSIQINNRISKEKLLEYLYRFVKEIKDSKIYLNYDGYDASSGKENFITHFSRWLKIKNA